MIEYVDRDVQHLLHMITAIKRLRRLLADVEKERFLSEESLQDAAAFSISTIGESAARVTDDFKSRHPEIPWNKMRGMRNRLVHVFDYDQIDYDIVWDVAANALPSLEPVIRSVLEKIPLPEDFHLPEV